MKKCLFIFGVLIVLTACEDEEYEISSDQITIVDEVYYSWVEDELDESELDDSWIQDESDDNIHYHLYYAEIQNDGEYPVDVSATISWSDEEHGVYIGESENVDVEPNVIEPGETGYVHARKIPSPTMEDIGDAELTLSVDDVGREYDMLEYETINISEDADITGQVTNTTDEQIEHVNIVSGLYDDTGSLIAVATTYSDISESFEATVSVLPVTGDDVADHHTIVYHKTNEPPEYKPGLDDLWEDLWEEES